MGQYKMFCSDPRVFSTCMAYRAFESDRAQALRDLRIPAAVTVNRVRAELAADIDPSPDASWRIINCTELSWTGAEEEIVRAVREYATAVTERKAVVNLRAGFSGARSWWHSGVPIVAYGVAPNGMGGADKYATVADLKTVIAVYSLAGFDCLKGK